jgi:XTP/dITP diphosphohydrolase
VNIVIASKNKKKIEEIKRIFEKECRQDQSRGAELFHIKIFTLNDFPECPDIIEDGETFEENAIKKALSVAKYTDMTALADDSGLEVYALNRAPGVHSARYAGEDTDDKRNIEKLLYEMYSYAGDKRKARFVCSVVLVLPDGKTNTFHGYIEGRIGTESKGCGGFGYDPVFYPEGYTKTFSEMDEDEKDAISHRGMALNKAYQFLKGI